MNDRCLILSLALVAALISVSRAADPLTSEWKVGAPIVNYWAGPGYPGGSALDDAAAKQLKEGGWNVVWCNEKELDVAQRHGLRGLLTDPLLSSAAHNNDLDDPQKREVLDAFINRVKKHPALYAYHLRDEPSAAYFGHIGKVVAYLRERDPVHVSYINLFPIYASNEQLGTKGEPRLQGRANRGTQEFRTAGCLRRDNWQVVAAEWTACRIASDRRRRQTGSRKALSSCVCPTFACHSTGC